MNKKIFFYIFGMNLLFFSVILLFSGLCSFLFNDNYLPFVISFLISCSIGGFFAYRNRDYTALISKKDGRLLIGMLWIIMPLVGAIPYMIHGLGFTNSLFESYSGFTTTGASIIKNVELMPKGLLLYRSFTQWLGGLGFAVFIIIFLKDLRNGANNLFNAEFNSIEKEKDSPHIISTVYKIFTIYFLLTLFCFLLLLKGEMTWFEAICHSLSTISTGGFSVNNANIGAYDNYSQYVIITFMFLSGISYFLFLFMIKGKWKRLLKDEQLRFYVFIILLFTAFFVFYFVLSRNVDLASAIRVALFYIVSIVSSTGFDLQFGSLGMLPTIIFIFLMFVGGCSASSSTGLKIVRVIVLLRYIPVSLKRIFHPRAIIPVRYNGKALRDESVRLIFGFFFLFLLLFLIGAFLLSLMGNGFITSLSLSAAAISNMGPIMGSIAEGFSYLELNVFSKYTLIVLMLIGRLEIYAFFALFSKTVWGRN
ncbi:MAG: TrkH family potassium uptake protein [Bacteroidales bacterium]|nr:TrkH family potassium uptake protein [Bacteroidales bacterium]